MIWGHDIANSLENGYDIEATFYFTEYSRGDPSVPRYKMGQVLRCNLRCNLTIISSMILLVPFVQLASEVRNACLQVSTG